MRHRETLYLQIAKTKTRAGFEKLPIYTVAEIGLHDTRGRSVSENFDVRKTRQPTDSGRMIAVFVSEKNRLNVFEGFTDGGEQLACFASGKPRVD